MGLTPRDMFEVVVQSWRYWWTTSDIRTKWKKFVFTIAVVICWLVIFSIAAAAMILVALTKVQLKSDIERLKKIHSSTVGCRWHWSEWSVRLCPEVCPNKSHCLNCSRWRVKRRHAQIIFPQKEVGQRPLCPTDKIDYRPCCIPPKETLSSLQWTAWSSQCDSNNSVYRYRDMDSARGMQLNFKNSGVLFEQRDSEAQCA